MPIRLNLSLEDVADAARHIETPRDYFRGVGSGSGGVENVICFHRSNRKALLEGAARHVHHRYVLIVNCGGAGKVGIQDCLHDFAPGDALLIRPHQIHYFPEIEDPGFCWFFATFEYAGIKLPFAPHAIAVSERARLYVGMLCEAFIASKTRVDAQEDTSALLGLLMRELSRSSRSRPRPGKQPKDALIDRIISHVYTYLEDEIGVQETADKVGMSESHLRREFRRRSGQSLGNFIKRARIVRAAGLLVESSLPIGEIATRCGYTSIYSFSRAFTLSVGQSPRSYRNRIGGRDKPSA